MKILQLIAGKVAKTDIARQAIEEQTDLSAFKEKPSIRIIIGLIVIALSYLLGWPAVGFFGILSVYFENPLILAIGGPLIYGFSHILLWIGVYIAGAKYTMTFLRWAIRRFVEKYTGE